MDAKRNAPAEDALIKKWYDEARDDNREHQWPGVTTLISCLTRAYYEKTFLPAAPSRQLTLLFATGLWLEQVILGNEQHATAGELNGIFYHTDTTKFNLDGIEKLGEVKSTRTSMSKGYMELNPAWHKQLLSYMKTEDRTEATVIILHLMGDYRPPFPDVRVYDITATQEEIDDNWLWMRGRKKVLEDAIESHIPPEPFEWRVVDWAGADEKDAMKVIYEQGYECTDNNGNPTCAFFEMCKQRHMGLL